MKYFFLIFCFFTVIDSFGQSLGHFIREGNNFYKRGKMVEAIDFYNKAADGKYKYIVGLNKGNALFKQKKYEEAITAYQVVADAADAAILLKSGAHYNIGVIYSTQQKLVESIEEYKQALRMNWQDRPARENLQKAMWELKQQEQQNKQNNQQKQPKSKMSQNQVQNQLNKLEQKEKNTQKKRADSKSNFGSSTGKDW